MHVDNVIIITPPRNHGGVTFSLQFVCVYVCVIVCVRDCVCVCVCVCVSIRKQNIQSNGCTNLDAVFAKRLLASLF